MPTKRLPHSADIDHLKHQAKDLLSDFRAGKMSAFQRIREFHPKFAGLDDTEIASKTPGFSDALLSIAREYGYASWPRLKGIVAKAQGLEASVIHNERITDDSFRQALDFLDEGNVPLLKAHLAANPDLVHQRVLFEGDNYFTKPRLIEFVAENPIRQGHLPDNIVEVAKIILDAGAKDHQSSLDYALGLTASGRIAREHGAQIPLIDLFCDYGAGPETALHTALAHGEFAAAHQLVAHGTTLDLSSAAALNMGDAVADLLPGASPDQLQLGLALAANHGWDKVVTVLLGAGADPNRYNPPGGHSHCTPLHSAAFGGHAETVKALVEGGARADIGDIHRGATALAWAEFAGHSDIVSYLRAKH